ncbi:MAG TPA: DUF4331 domain-containing protein [Candidatus Dormibacteraeota bacterium]
MSSHREAPEISKDPVADSTDLYAFVSPDAPDTVTILANYIPLQGPAGGPNFYEFGDDVLYEINIDNNADALPDVTYQFRFETEVRHPDSFLYNTGQIGSLDSDSWNRRQFYTVTRIQNGVSTVLGSHLACPPCNIGPRSTPMYEEKLGHPAVQDLGNGVMTFAGQRAEAFYVDLGSIFDLGDLRPFQHLHLIPTPDALGVNATEPVNVHTIAIQVPKTQLTRDGSKPTDPASGKSVIGVWTAAYRRRARVLQSGGGGEVEAGPFVQVSRLGNPLFNEVIVPMGDKDRWNALPPSADGEFAKYVDQPELARLLPILYPGATFMNLAGLNGTSRFDLDAILLTGIPTAAGLGFQNFTGATKADMLRLNMAIGPTAVPNPLGLVAGDPAGFPNGRRPVDDVVTIEVRAIAGLTWKLLNPGYTLDGAATAVMDGSVDDDSQQKLGLLLDTFPYLGTPYSGYEAGQSA